jgi:hypothetical protein
LHLGRLRVDDHRGEDRNEEGPHGVLHCIRLQ